MDPGRTGVNRQAAQLIVEDHVAERSGGGCRRRYDHVAVGTGTVVNKTSIKQYQQATRDRSSVKTEGGKIIRVEAHPIPEHPRPRRCKGRVALVGDAAGYVTKCSGGRAERSDTTQQLCMIHPQWLRLAFFLALDSQSDIGFWLSHTW